MNPRERAAQMVGKAISLSGLTQKEIAERAGMDASNLVKYTKGNKGMTVDVLFRIVEACGLEVIELRVRKMVK
jgi:transcriptional regulator with XRE-family HTH domain